MVEVNIEIKVTRQIPYGSAWVEIYKAEVKIENDDKRGIHAAAHQWCHYTHEQRVNIFKEFIGDPNELTNFKAEVSVKEDGDEILNDGNGYILVADGNRRFVQAAAIAAEDTYFLSLCEFLKDTYDVD